MKGRLGPGQVYTAALLPKILPGHELSADGKFEIEKLKVSLKWKYVEDGDYPMGGADAVDQ